MLTRQQTLKILADFIAIKSISTDPSFQPEILKAVKFISDLLTPIDFKIHFYRRFFDREQR